MRCSDGRGVGGVSGRRLRSLLAGLMRQCDGRPTARRQTGTRSRVAHSVRWSQRFGLEGALQIGGALEEVDGHWFAEPLRDGDVTGLQRLSDALSVPVVGGAFMGDSILAGTRALTTRTVDRVRIGLPDGGGSRPPGQYHDLSAQQQRVGGSHFERQRRRCCR
jgi:hypothetical protein